MIKSLLLIITLAHGGFWSAGEEGRIAMTWAVADSPMPESVISWQLFLGDLELTSARQDIAGGSGEIKIKMPETRVATDLQWRYQLKRKDSQQLLQSGTLTIHVIPPGILAQKARLFAGKRILVLDEPARLPALLSHGGITHERVSDLNTLALAEPDFILIGENQLPANPLADDVLMRQARRGAGVAVFLQSSRENVLGHPTVLRPAGSALVMRSRLLRFDPLAEADLSAWAAPHGELRAIRLRADDPAVPLVTLSDESNKEIPALTDALIASISVGKGRILVCQLPVGAWQQDLRGEMFLAGMLDYLLSPAEPGKEELSEPAAKPANIYPKGDKP